MTDPTAVNADPFQRYEGPPRKEVVAGSVSSEEKQSILARLAEKGFQNMSEGVREICLAYRDSEEVRDVVHRFLEERAARAA